MFLRNIATDNSSNQQIEAFCLQDIVSQVPDETLVIGTPTTKTATQLMLTVNASYTAPFAFPTSPNPTYVFRFLYSVAGGTVVVSTLNQASQTITLQPKTWYQQRGFTGLVAGGTVTDLVIGF